MPISAISGPPPSRWGSTTVRSSGISRWPSRSTPIFTLPESAPFYNVKKPLTTQLGYITAGQRQYAEENISILHAQNITPSTGFNVTYHTMGTRGIYMNQATRDTDFSFGVSHNGKRYTGYAGYIFNTIRMQENGGVVDDWYITGVKKERPFEIPFMLSDARNILKNNTFYTFQQSTVSRCAA